MISITKHGQIPKSQGECAYCGCKFKYDWRDVSKRFYYWVQCPCCDRELLVSKESIDTLKLNDNEI